MKFLNILAFTTAVRCAHGSLMPISNELELSSRLEAYNNCYSYSECLGHDELWKRKGGGGGGGHGGSSGSARGSSGSSGSRSGTSSSSLGSSSSNAGGRTTKGSGVKPSYGSGGKYYAGGATQPYRAGSNSIGSGIIPGLFLGSALGFWDAYWIAGAYHYPYSHPYIFHNQSSNQNETKPIECLCKTDEECGCEDNSSDSEYMNSILGNGSYAGLNQSVVIVANVNGTDTIFINGTLANGTTASGGIGNPNAAGGMSSLLQAVGRWPLAAIVLALVHVA